MIRILLFFAGRLSRAFVPLTVNPFKDSCKSAVGKIFFYGPPDFVEKCVEAINVILPRYDALLYNEILKSRISLCFYFDEKNYVSYHTAGLYSIPAEIVAFNSHGIGQNIVWRYFQSTETGVGFIAALRDIPTLHFNRLVKARAKMLQWLKGTGYSTAWLECYSDVRANKANETPQ